MNRFVLAVCLLPVLGCAKGSETASNPATEYAKSLSEDTGKARAAAAAAGRAIAETKSQADAAQSQE